MNIVNEQQFFAILHTKGIDRRDYNNEYQLFADVVMLENEKIIDFIINNYPDMLNYNVTDCAIYLPFKLCKRILDAAIKNNNDINLENIAIDYFKRGNETEEQKMLELLFEEYKVDPNGKNGMIFTEACHYGDMNAVTYLIEKHNVDPNINSEMGYIFACRFGNFNVAKYLVEHGANYKAKNNLGLKLLTKYEMSHPIKQWLVDLYTE
jgi:hypothetical protein